MEESSTDLGKQLLELDEQVEADIEKVVELNERALALTSEIAVVATDLGGLENRYRKYSHTKSHPDLITK